jgi:phosphopantetheine adenylyltransferase
MWQQALPKSNGSQQQMHWIKSIRANRQQILMKEFDWRKPTVQMLGRWQPWHAGHRALFERAVAKTGQVCIMIRDCEGWNDSNPFKKEEVENFIHQDLREKYEGQYIILFVPNITNITYGRNVGYKIENEVFDEDTHAISATEIRKQMGLK